jgi:hypothetical protein
MTKVKTATAAAPKNVKVQTVKNGEVAKTSAEPKKTDLFQEQKKRG